ncbi:MAG TPA: hypothetical protein PK766_12860, partial [Bacteroidales bacterium]|nr:hypothetical protein [Bacteroidales bacterium]
MNEFESYSSGLFKILSGEVPGSDFLKSLIKDVPTPRYLIKGDVSGIQNFIFTIPSKYASKELKARSEYIKKYTSGWFEEIREKCGEIETLSAVGGNFYLFANVPDTRVLEEIEKRICLESPEGLFLALSLIKADDPDDFENIRNRLEMEGALKKLRKYSNSPELFEPRIAKAPQLFHLLDNFRKDQLPSWNDVLMKAFLESSAVKGYEAEPGEEPSAGNIISFRHLAWFAEIRTGTAKIAVMKMDIDNLGLFFSGLGDFGNVKQASQCLEYFFSQHIFNILGNGMKQKTVLSELPGDMTLFRNNIYIVFSGGDDCFILGAWDAVLEFAVLVRHELRKFTREDDLDAGSSKITMSASVQLYSPAYPVYKFAAE